MPSTLHSTRLQAALAAGLLGLVVWASAGAAKAAFPGANGKLAFISTRDGNAEVYAMSALGAGQIRLTDSTSGDFAPAWSADGSRIAFSSFRDGNWDVYVMDADGTHPANLTRAPADDLQPSWSPGGGKIAYTSLRSGNAEVYAMNADGTGQEKLAGTSADDFHPAWSPDGSRIAFTSVRDGNAEVYAMNADGSGQTNLTQNPAEDYSQDWQPLPAVMNRPPDCSTLVADPPRVERSQRHGFEIATVNGARDPDGDELSFRLERVTQDEPVMGRHRVTLAVSDARGGVCSGIATVEVRRWRHTIAIDDGDKQSWDSFSKAPEDRALSSPPSSAIALPGAVL